jgi:hypothetical protein
MIADASSVIAEALLIIWGHFECNQRALVEAKGDHAKMISFATKRVFYPKRQSTLLNFGSAFVKSGSVRPQSDSL